MSKQTVGAEPREKTGSRSRAPSPPTGSGICVGTDVWPVNVDQSGGRI